MICCYSLDINLLYISRSSIFKKSGSTKTGL